MTWERDSVTSVTRLCNTVATPRPRLSSHHQPNLTTDTKTRGHRALGKCSELQHQEKYMKRNAFASFIEICVEKTNYYLVWCHHGDHDPVNYNNNTCNV